MDLIREIKRRRVVRVVIAYTLIAWLLIQVAETTFEPLQLPPWTITLVVVLAILGFPLAVFFAWAYQAGPEGIERDKGPDAEQADATEKPAGTAPVPASEPVESPEPEAPEKAKGPSIPDDSSIAVLPFMNLSDSEENQYFSDGLAEELLTMLSRVPGLRVCSRTSSFACRGQNLDIPTVAQKLGVRNVLEGSVRRAGQRVRITAQLIDGKSDSHLWAENFDRNLDDIFAVQDEIAAEITSALKLALTPDQQRAVSDTTTSTFEAYDRYLRGRELYHRTDRDHLLRAKEAFEEAIRIDPEYALAYAGLTYCLADFYWYHSHEHAPMIGALASSERAVQLADHLAESHAARGLAFSAAERFEDAEREYERAIEINPQLFEPLHFYARMCRTRGEQQKAADLYMRAAQARPEDYQSVLSAVQCFEFLNQPEKAKAASREGLLRAERHLNLNPLDARAMLFLGMAKFDAGDSDACRELTEKALSLEPDTAGVVYNSACCYVDLEEQERALDLLERLHGLGWHHPVWLDSDADLDPVRDHPRFKALRAEFDA